MGCRVAIFRSACPRQLSLARLHLLVAIPAMALLVVLVPPIQSPDETLHVCRAGALSRGAIMSVTDEQGRVGGYVDSGLWWFRAHFLDIFGGRGGKMSWERFERARGLRWVGALTFCEIPGLNYGPIGYAPQALGLLLGRLLGCSVLVSYYLARLFAAMTGLALGNAALRLMTCGRLLAFVVLVLPMTLFLGASTSQDALQIRDGAHDRARDAAPFGVYRAAEGAVGCRRPHGGRRLGPRTGRAARAARFRAAAAGGTQRATAGMVAPRRRRRRLRRRARDVVRRGRTQLPGDAPGRSRRRRSPARGAPRASGPLRYPSS